MLTPLDYRDDCKVMFGRLLPHDAQLGKTELADAFERTKSMWHASRGEPYVYRPSPDARRESAGGYAGCGSCGWGDADFHAQLGHPQEEAAQIARAYGGGGSRDESEGAAKSAAKGAAKGAAWGAAWGAATRSDPSDASIWEEGARYNAQSSTISEAWASDAPSHAASGGGGEGVMSDPWAAPADELRAAVAAAEAAREREVRAAKEAASASSVDDGGERTSENKDGGSGDPIVRWDPIVHPPRLARTMGSGDSSSDGGGDSGGDSGGGDGGGGGD